MGQSGNPIAVKTAGAATDLNSGAAAQILAQTRAQGHMLVMVGIKIRMRDEENMTSAERSKQARKLRRRQQGIINRVLGDAAGQRHIRRFESVAHMAMEVNEPEMRRLLVDPKVISVHAQVPAAPALPQGLSRPMN